MEVTIFQDEAWYGGETVRGYEQPYTADTRRILQLDMNHTPNQMMPLLLSTAGRWLWRENGMEVSLADGIITCPDDAVYGETGGTLGDAYREAMKQCFPFRQIRLDRRFVEQPVYNSWIELTFDQNQADILRYARDILAHGMPPGILMIDDGWSDYYGRWRFSAEAFPDPAGMIQELRQMGFTLMVWICPFITPDTKEFRELERKGLLLRDAQGSTHIVHWWNGWSAVLDMTKPEAAAWLKGQLDRLQAMGVAGFKFDAGDSLYYTAGLPASPDEHSRAWAHFGEQYSFNEFRVTSGAGGWSLMQRLCDKHHSWDESGLAALIPAALVQGLTGHPFLSPDMIGGGEYLNFHSLGSLDEELFVRWAEIAALMPVTQFSAAPWRVLSAENFHRILAALEIRKRWFPYLSEAWDRAADSGEPILRPLAYSCSEPGCLRLTDQFMIGERLLAAPCVKKSAAIRPVYLPAGQWLHEGTVIHSEGELVLLDAAAGPAVLERL